MIRLLVSTLSLGVALISAMPAAAQEDKVSIHVGYGDLDLASTAGMVAFKHRVDAAVTAICGSSDEIDLQRRVPINACRREVRSGVDGQMQTAITNAHQDRMVASAEPLKAGR